MAFIEFSVNPFSLTIQKLSIPKSLPTKTDVSSCSPLTELYPDEFAYCPEQLCHKVYLIHPNLLEQNGIRFDIILQRPGDYIITYPGGIHGGFNLGQNLNEAKNFGSPSWIKIGKWAEKFKKFCRCEQMQSLDDDDTSIFSMDTFPDDYTPALNDYDL